jgi:cysteine synthase A
MKALGAKVILTPAAERGSGMVRRAEELAKEHNWFLASQFENPANPEYHRNTTAPEILRDFAGHALDYFVSGWGTGGTITGTGEVLKAARPEIKIIGTEPENANLLGGAEWQPHKIQGWTPDFIPKVLNPDIIDELILVNDEASISTAMRLAKEEGIFCGISAGATMQAALIVAEKAPKNSTICVMLPDTGERYLSTPLFENITEESDDAWLATQ